DATLVAVSGDTEAATGDVDELVVVATAGEAKTELGASIPVVGTPIGEVFRESAPKRFDRLGMDVGGGPALVLPLRANDTVAGVLVALRRDGARAFTAEQ